MGFNSVSKWAKIVKKKNPGNGRLNNLNDPSRPQCVKKKSSLGSDLSPARNVRIVKKTVEGLKAVGEP